MSSNIFVCEQCYDIKLMGLWEEYTGGALHGSCVLCGAQQAQHWFASPRGIIKDLVTKLRAVSAVETSAAPTTSADEVGKAAYAKYVDDSGIHSNRFPSWSELTQPERDKWTRSALNTSANTGEEP